jgi:hypothetical protein
MTGTWHVTHSTLPMWKKARNVTITYSPTTQDPTKLGDLVKYNPLQSDKVKTISGVDTPAGSGSWNWRGNGWLMIASSHWEVLGWGEEEDESRNSWVVTYFAKTLFTPAGIDLYSRSKEGLKPETVELITKAIKENAAEVVRALAGEMFVIAHG